MQTARLVAARLCVAALLVVPLFSQFAKAARPQPGDLDLNELTLRCRVTAMTPEVPVRVFWRFGGEGQGGGVNHGEFTQLPRKVPDAPKELPLARDKDKPALGDDLLDDLAKAGEKPAGPQKQFTVEGKAFEYVYLKRDTWSPAVTIAQMAKGGRPPVFTITLQPYGDLLADKLRDVKMEFELSHRGKVIKTFSEIGPDGPTVGIALGLRAIRLGMKADDPRYVDEVCGLAEYSLRRANDLERLPWAHRPTPNLYAIVTDCSGYGVGSGYGVRTTNMKVMENEFRVMKQFGVNGLRGAPAEVLKMANRREGWAKDFTKAVISHSMGYPVAAADADEETGWYTSVPPGAGDPYFPGTLERAKPQMEEAIKHMLDYRGFDEVWGLTVDEIGCVFDRGPEKKNMIYTSPYCMAAWKEFLKQNGVTPADCGAKTWDEVDPWTSTAPRPLNWAQMLAKHNEAQYQKTLGFKVRVPGDDEPTSEANDVLDDIALAAQPKAASAPGEPTSKVPPRAEALIRYYNSLFINYASGKAFSPLRDALATTNAQKQAALDRGDTTSAAAGQPWVYSYALRGQTFIRRHSLDFFEFYRHADNAFVYETSHTNRLTQIFDSYICDVGRVVSQDMDKKFGIYVKPHRGSGNQRAMSFVARGGTMLYWYTYGPAWKKGDSFSENPELLHNVSRFSRILARAEDVMYGAKWDHQPEVAIVKPRTTTLLGGRIDNALWHYTALAHAHVPVDPLDEIMLETQDLSRYKVIFIGGEFIRRKSAEKLAAWVRDGGTLYTSDQGMALDESRQPLTDVLGPIFGVTARGAYVEFGKDHPATSNDVVAGDGSFGGGITPAAREALETASSAEVLVKFADGKPALIKNRVGKGTAYLCAFPAGLAYGAKVGLNTADQPLNMERHADAALRHYVVAPALERVTRPVDVSIANVEAVPLRHPKSQRRAVPLINWAYEKGPDGRLKGIEFKDVVVTLNGASGVSKVISSWLDRELPLQRDGDQLKVTLSELGDCDVLLLE